MSFSSLFIVAQEKLHPALNPKQSGAGCLRQNQSFLKYWSLASASGTISAFVLARSAFHNVSSLYANVVFVQVAIYFPPTMTAWTNIAPATSAKRRRAATSQTAH